jgi:hypothetical protein
VEEAGLTDSSRDGGLQAWLLRAAEPSADAELDAGLRSLGLNYKERDALRRGPTRPFDRERFKQVILKQFRFHVDRRTGGRLPAEDAARLAAAWAILTDHDLDLAQRLWDTGFDPAAPKIFNAFLEAGLDVADLDVMVGGKTVATHLREGQPLRWCIEAILWSRADTRR